MATYLRLFETESEYIDFLNSDEFVRPNLSYVVSDGDVKFHSEPILEPQEYDVKLTYNATADNLKPFVLMPSNMSRLAIDGVEVPFEAPVVKTGMTEILKDECTYVVENEMFSIPEHSFVPVKGLNATLSPKDPTISLNDVDYLFMYIYVDGGCEPMFGVPIKGINYMYMYELGPFINIKYNENVVEIKNLLERLFGPDILLAQQEGVKISFLFANEDKKNGLLELVETTLMYSYIEGGYLEDIIFDKEGQHTVELSVLRKDFNGQVSNTLCDINMKTIEDIYPSAFSGCTNLPIIDDIRYADTYVIRGVQNATSVYTVKDGTKWLGNSAFEGINVKSIYLPNTLKKLGIFTFTSCTDMTTINIPNSVKTIPMLAFLNCGIKEVIFNEGLEQIMPFAFYMCYYIEHIHIPSTVFYIGEGAFDTTDTEQITVDENNEWYNSSNNCNCIIETKTKKLIRACDNSIIPNDIEHIASNGFANCRTIKSIILPETVKTIGDFAFYCCMDATTIELSQQITEIKDNTFDRCYDLTSVTIPSNVTSLGSKVFYMSGVKSITCQPLIAPTIFDDTFTEMKSNGILYYPSGSDYSSWITKLPSGWTSQEI